MNTAIVCVFVFSSRPAEDVTVCVSLNVLVCLPECVTVCCSLNVLQCACLPECVAVCVCVCVCYSVCVTVCVSVCAALINLLKFLLSNETTLLAKHNIFHLALLVGNTHTRTHTPLHTPTHAHTPNPPCPGVPGGEPLQHVHHVRGHLPAHVQQLRRALLRGGAHAPGV